MKIDIDMVFGNMGTFLTHIYCLVGCLNMIVWTHAVLGVFYAFFFFFFLVFVHMHLFSATEHVSHGKAL